MPRQSPDPARPVPGRRRARLSRDRVLAAALALVDAKGVDALTMRALGRQLGCDPMALYRYTPNRDAVLDGIVERVLGQLTLSQGPPAQWPDQLRRFGQEFRRVALAHPRVVPILVTRPRRTPLGLRPAGTLRPVEQLLDRLIGAGFDPVDALHVYRTFIGLLYGHVLTELQELTADLDETDDLLRLGLQALPLRDFPRIRGLATTLAEYDGAAELDASLDILLTGLNRRLGRTG
jgi:AcrR family transcriptional regulator